MVIVHVCLAGKVTDGFSYQDNILPKYHRMMGLDVHVLCSRWIECEGKDGMDNRANYMNEDDVHMIRLAMKGKENFSRKFKTYKNLYATLEELHPDILFIHGVSYRDVKTIVKYLKEHREVVAYADSHADFSNSATNWISKNILHKIIWKYYANMLTPYVRKFYGVLPARVDFLVDVYGLPKDKCELLVMGADDEKVERAADPKIKEKIRLKHGIDKSDFLIVTGGKIDRWKTQTLLLMEAVKKFGKPNVKLIVFGSVVEELKEQVSALADGNSVQYIGWIKGDDSYEYFAAADLAVFPGRHSVFWEQVAGQGIPLICKYWAGTTHVDVGGNVQFLKEDSVNEIYDKLVELVDFSPKYQEMKAAAGSKGKDTFSYSQIAVRSIEADKWEGK